MSHCIELGKWLVSLAYSGFAVICVLGVSVLGLKRVTAALWVERFGSVVHPKATFQNSCVASLLTFSNPRPAAKYRVST